VVDFKKLAVSAMKDPITVLLAILTLAGGISSLFRPEWYYADYATATAAQKKQTKTFGVLVAVVGLILLICCLFVR
jgi:Flp pilus assembly protein CpaB